MENNRELLQELIDDGELRLRRGRIFDEKPSSLPAPIDFDRVEGMLLGVAIGDSLGAPTEGVLPHDRQELFGEVRDYATSPRYGQARGFPTDDTQLTFWTLEQLIADGKLVPENLADSFTRGRIFGIGSTVQGFLIERETGKPWYRCGPESAGNGALMRISPVLLPHLMHPSPGLWADAALSAAITHNDTASISACVGFVALLWDLLGMEEPPEPGWWLRRWIEVSRDLESGTVYRPRGGDARDYEGPFWPYVEENVSRAYERGIPTVEACNSWYSGAYLLETVPCVVYILMCHGHDPEEAIVRAVNDTRDNDTVGAVVGAAVGALHGRRGLPERWVEGLSGRTREDDDGRVFELIAEARAKFGRAGSWRTET